MKDIFKFGANTLEIVKNYPVSLLGGIRCRKLFKEVNAYCMFIGFSRSGKTMLASLLDAHPKVVIADGFEVLKYVHAGFGRREIFYLLLKNSQAFTKTGRSSRGYSYRVPNQWQGKFKKLQVIGDNKGEGAVLRLYARTWLLQRLRNTIGVNLRFIHVIRNPYDNIGDLSTRKDIKDLKGGIKHYFSICNNLTEIKKQLKNSELFEIRHETMIANPKACLRELGHFLGVDASKDYLDDCASIIFESPVRFRYEVKWSPELIDIVKEKMALFPFLQGYSYND